MNPPARIVTILSVVLLLLVGPTLVSAATLTKRIHLEFTGSAPGGDDPNYYETTDPCGMGGLPYSSVLVPEASLDGGAVPIFDGDTMYVDGSNSSGYRKADECLEVPVGSGYTLYNNYVFEALVKPDYPLPTETPPDPDGTNNGRSDILFWGVFDGPNPKGICRISSNNEGACLEFNVSDWAPGNVDFPGSCADPCMIITIPSDWPAGQGDYSHVAMVYSYDSGTGKSKYFGYLNGLLVGVDIDTYSSGLPFPANFYIGSGVNDSGTSRGTGWKGWYDAVAVSTFTGEFDESDFILVQYPRFCGDHNHQYLSADVTKDCRVDLEDFALVSAEWLSSSVPN